MSNNHISFRNFAFSGLLFLGAHWANATVSVKVFMADQTGLLVTDRVRHSIVLQNTGTDTLKDIYFCYYISVPDNKAPLIVNYNIFQCVLSMEKLSSGVYRLKYLFPADSGSLAPGETLQNKLGGEQAGIHYSDFSNYNKSGDYSYMSNIVMMMENKKIPVFSIAHDSLIYGIPPSFSDISGIRAPIHLDKVLFDSATNAVKVFWTNDSASQNTTIGIACIAAGNPFDTGLAKQIIIGNRASDSASILLGQSILFDTTYFVALYFKKGAGFWSSPVETTITTPSYTWQDVVYFHLNRTRDTTYAFNKNIRLSNDIASDPITDKLIAWSPLNAATNGFIPVSVGFYFKQKSSSPNFYIGLRCDSIPQGYSAQNIRIYCYNNGAWLVEPNSSYDSACGYASVKTHSLDYPYVAMINTVKPLVLRVGDSLPVVPGKAIIDTFLVSGNISNMTCALHFSKGEHSYSEGDSSITILSLSKDSVITTIPGSWVSEDNGVRAFFTVSDGAFAKSIDVSRQIIRMQRSDAIMTDAMQWMPLHATAIPDTADIQHALRNFADNGAWSYNPTVFRLFRWYPCESNVNKSDKYLEYADSIQNLFSIAPGNILWLKSRKQSAVDFGRAVTPSLSVPYEIDLQPGQWTDIALPFDFGMYLGDILASTSAAGQPVDSIEWYQWSLDSIGGYFADPFQIHGLSEGASSLDNTSYPLASQETVGYTVRNNSNNTIRLLIPPIPKSMSDFSAPPLKKSTPGNWALKIRGRTTTSALSPVYCGFVAGQKKDATFFSPPPQRGDVALRVCDGQKRLFGHELARGGDGATFALAFVNNSSGAAIIDYGIDNVDQLPLSMGTLLIDPETGKTEPIDKPLKVSVDAGQCVFRTLTVGSAAYLAKTRQNVTAWKLDLLGAYPNPFNKVVRLRYSLPQQGVNRIKLSIVSVFGRVVFETTQLCQGKSGVHELVWNGLDGHNKPMASGVYVVKLTALDEKSRSSGVFEKKITCLP